MNWTISLKDFNYIFINGSNFYIYKEIKEIGKKYPVANYVKT